jgi:hypothetical protein
MGDLALMSNLKKSGTPSVGRPSLVLAEDVASTTTRLTGRRLQNLMVKPQKDRPPWVPAISDTASCIFGICTVSGRIFITKSSNQGKCLSKDAFPDLPRRHDMRKY